MSRDGLSIHSHSTSTITFRYPANPQRSSQLYHLPAEIRLRVLRYLLVYDDFIPNWPGNTRDAPTSRSGGNHWLSLSSQILQCCQLLYSTGTTILYQENTISVRVFNCPVSLGSYKENYYLSILDECTGFPTQPGQHSLESIPRKYRLYPLNGGTYSLPSQFGLRQISSNTYKMLLRFQNLRVEVDINHSHAAFYGDNMYLFSLAYLLRDYMSARKVTVSLRPLSIDTPEWPLQIKCFELWRCSSITFVNASTKSIMTDRQTRMTQQTISGPTPVANMSGMIDVYSEVLHFIRNGQLQSEFPSHWREALWAMIGQDQWQFKDEVLAMFRVLMAETKAEIANLKMEAEEDGEGSDFYTEIREEMLLWQAHYDRIRAERQFIASKFDQM